MRNKTAVKLTAAIVVIVCLMLGIVGIVLPLIPGLLFLAIAAAVVARHSPWARERLHRHKGLRQCLHHADGLIDSDWREKLQLAGLYVAKAIVDGLEKISAAARSWLTARRQTGQSSFRT